MKRSPVGLAARLDRALQVLLAASVAGSLLVMAGVVIGLIVARYIFGIGVFWGEELARYAMIYMGFLGAAIALRDNQHPRLTIFLDLMPWGVRRVVGVLSSLILLTVLGVLFWQGWDFAINEGRMRTPALRIAYFWIFLAIPIGAGAMILQLVLGHIFPPVMHLSEDEGVAEVTE